MADRHRDYVRYGLPRSLSLFRAMTRYPTLERLPNLVVPTLVVAGTRDPLVRQDRLPVLSALPHVQVVRMAGAHALNFSRGEPMADLIETFMADRSLQAAADRHDGVEVVALA